MSWKEFDDLISILIKKLSNKGINIIAPMLRTGGIIGGVISVKTEIITMLPVQFKYSYNPTTINQISSIPNLLNIMPVMNVLLCEGNTSTGSIAIKASRAIREKYPHAKVYLATLTKVFGCPEKLEGIEGIFCGTMTNEAFKASKEEVEKLHLREGITIFPWENIKSELSDINNGL